ncbi:Uncharacterised protein [Arcanobacterium haemolyticum]|uniref:hypothetical protein n=1 Tax=Arcanobacterium haemolyticum TaxID=28264 RepID=UPI000D926E34|nr:hypothetical protein [Arcanobacterium haemolyticum]SPT76033.1 Uncharacterised protein [Arcanobacterium haemolyticum]
MREAYKTSVKVKIADGLIVNSASIYALIDYDPLLFGPAWLGGGAARIAEEETRSVVLAVLDENSAPLAQDMSTQLAFEQIDACGVLNMHAAIKVCEMPALDLGAL